MVTFDVSRAEWGDCGMWGNRRRNIIVSQWIRLPAMYFVDARITDAWHIRTIGETPDYDLMPVPTEVIAHLEHAIHNILFARSGGC